MFRTKRKEEENKKQKQPNNKTSNRRQRDANEWNVNRFYSRESFLLDCRIYDVIKLNIFHAIGDLNRPKTSFTLNIVTAILHLFFLFESSILSIFCDFFFVLVWFCFESKSFATTEFVQRKKSENCKPILMKENAS